MQKKLCARAIANALDHQHEYLALDDDFLAGAQAALARGLTDPIEAAAFAIAWRSGFLARAASSESAPEPDTGPDIAAVEAARQEGTAAGATAERVRIKAILGLPEAEGREASAKHLAFTTDLTAADAAALLAVAPAQVPSLRQIPADALRSCHSPTGLLIYDETAGGAALPDAATGGGGVVSFIPHNPLKEAAERADPAARTKTAWKKVVGDLNASQAVAPRE